VIEERDDAPKANMPILIMSLFLSIILWGVVYAQNANPNPKEFEVSLSMPGLSPQLALLNPPKSIQVAVVASPERLKLIPSQLVGQVNLAHAHGGKAYYSVALPLSIKDIAVENTPSVQLSIEPVVYRTLPVQSGTRGKVSDKTAILTERNVMPKTVTVSGAESIMKSVAEARVTLDLAQEDPAHPTPQLQDIFLYDASGHQISEERGDLKKDSYQAEVTPTFTSPLQEKTAIVLVKLVGQANRGYAVTNYEAAPTAVTIRGSSIALARLSQIETGPVDLKGLTKDKQFTTTLVLPPGVNSTTPSKVKVRVTVRPVITNPTTP